MAGGHCSSRPRPTARARLGLGVGLYQDLAVSIDRGGAEAWANQDLYVVGASIGAPPDDLNLKGQNWGLPPLNPERLRAARYAPFIAMLRANMRHAGALRIDHVMGLARLYWIPPSGAAAEGAYVQLSARRPARRSSRSKAMRNRCMVIGEDLGTVPDRAAHGARRARRAVVPGALFERDANGDFAPPDAYPAEALVAATTHDLPTLAGFWDGRDLAVAAIARAAARRRSAAGGAHRARAGPRAAAPRARARAAAAAGRDRRSGVDPGR